MADQSERPFGYDVIDEGETRRLVPNEREQGIIGAWRRARRRGETYSAIGRAWGQPAMTVQRILTREETDTAPI